MVFVSIHLLHKMNIRNNPIMKSIFTLFFVLLISLHLSAQTVINDSVSIGAGYANQTFYSIAKGTVLSIDNTDWDLAFHTDNREVAIFINSKKDVKLYLASNDTSKWNSLDTANRTTKQYHNSDSSWSFGAFNREAPAGGFDYGWGTYNATTHEIYASKIYFINYGVNLWKKIIISKHDANYTYHFRYANLDGSNEISVVLKKSPYANKNFVYYSLTNNTIITREPDFTTYDLIFHQFEQEIPYTYKVTGAQQNRNVKAKKVYPVSDVNAATVGTTLLSKNITSVGSDWKTFDPGTNKWTIEDSTVYFIQDVTGAKIWKLVFTGFGGSSNGKMYFNKTAYASGINASSLTTLGIYPNPAHNNTTINFYIGCAQNVKMSVKDLTGKEVSSQEINSTAGFNAFILNTSSIVSGTYFVTIQSLEGIATQKLIINN